MSQKKNKVFKKKYKKIIEESYYPISFIDRVNMLYYQNSMKKISYKNHRDLSNIEK